MNEKRLKLKVGIFVLIALALVAATTLYFSKGTSQFGAGGTYSLALKTSHVWGLKSHARVLMAGVPIGHVGAITGDGKTATIQLKILEEYRIYPDAEFAIKSLGLMGDHHVAIIPAGNKGEPLQNGALAQAREPNL